MIAYSFEKLVAGVKSICCPVGMNPILCLSLDAFPVAVTTIKTSTSITVPVIAASFSPNGRIVCFPELSMLKTTNRSIGNTTELMINAVNWTSTGNFTMPTLLVISSHFNEIAAGFRSFGFSCEMFKSLDVTPLYEYKTIVMTSDVQDLNTDVLLEYTSNGGGLIIFHVAGASHSEVNNKLLWRYGLAYAQKPLDPSCCVMPIPVSSVAVGVKECNFTRIFMRLCSSLLQAKVHAHELDGIVSSFKYYVPCCKEPQHAQLMEVFTLCREYLLKTKYITDEGICPENSQKILAYLLQSLLRKVSIDSIPVFPGRELFPGVADASCSPSEHQFRGRVVGDSWSSTGIWIPAGEMCIVSIDRPNASLFMQIGSHTEMLPHKVGPWKRWPLPFMVFPMQARKRRVFTPFGGIVYLTSSRQEFDEEITLTVTNSLEYPRYKHDVWTTPCENGVPWAEIESPHVIWTVPVSEIAKCEFKPALEDMERVYASLSDFFRFESPIPLRIVTDVELPGDKLCSGYPILIDVDHMRAWMRQTIAKWRIDVVQVLAGVMMPEDVFDEGREELIIEVVACAAYSSIDEDFDPLPANTDEKFKVLWSISKHYGLSVLSDSLFDIAEDPLASKDMNWKQFITGISKRTERNIFKLFSLNTPPEMSDLPLFTM